MERVAVVGPGGAGKSTFSRALGDRTGLPVIHLDRHFWKPGWVETEREDWRRVQAELLAGERWIADGNYGGTFGERFSRADTVIVVARPRTACVASALGRTTRNLGRAVQAEGWPEPTPRCGGRRRSRCDGSVPLRDVGGKTEPRAVTERRDSPSPVSLRRTVWVVDPSG